MLSTAPALLADAEGAGNVALAEVSFFCFCFLSAAALQWIVSKIPAYAPPVSIVWFVYGLLAQLVVHYVESNTFLAAGIDTMARIDSNIPYYVLLPILLYEATQNINWHKFRRFLLSGLALAVLGVAFQVVIIGSLLALSFSMKWIQSYLIASTLGSTDPVAVISVLNNLQAPDKLSSMFDGESLINDGSAILLFQLFTTAASGESQSAGSVIGRLFSLLTLGPVFGFCLALVMYVWLSHFRRHHFMQILAVVTAAYLGYYLAEVIFAASGPLTVVTYGLVFRAFGHIALDRGALDKHLYFVEGLGLAANALIFVISGIIGMRMLLDVFYANPQDSPNYWTVPVLYIYLNIARGLMILAFMPLLRRTGYGVNWKEAVLLFWGGLRGAVVLVLALMIERNSDDTALEKNQALYMLSGCVFMNLFINGMSFEFLYNLLNPYPAKPFRRVYLERVMKMIDYEYMEEREVLEHHWLFKGSGALQLADRVVPILGWRKMKADSKIDTKLPSISKAFNELPEVCPAVFPEGIDSREWAAIDIATHAGKTGQRTVRLRRSTISNSTGQQNRERKEFDPQKSLRLLGHALEERELESDDSSEASASSAAAPPAMIARHMDTDATLTFPTQRDFTPASAVPARRFPRLPNVPSRRGTRARTSVVGAVSVEISPPESVVPPERLVPPESLVPPELAPGAVSFQDVSLALGKGEREVTFGGQRRDKDYRDRVSPLIRRRRMEKGTSKHLPERRRAFSDISLDVEAATHLVEASEGESAASEPVLSHLGSSAGSSEEYFDMPVTPRIGASVIDPTPRTRVKVLRREREGELYIMVFNALRQMYKHLYEQRILNGNSFLSLTTSLDLATDFAVGKLRSNPIPVWRDALSEVGPESTIFGKWVPWGRKRQPSGADGGAQNLTGFEVEWNVLRSRLSCLRLSWLKRVPSRFLRALLTFPAVVTDLQQVVAFVDVHEELLLKGGDSLQQLLGPKLLDTFYSAILEAKNFVPQIREAYPESFRFAVVVHAATLCLNLKEQLVEDQAQRGLLLDEDTLVLKRLFADQHFNLSRFRPVGVRLAEDGTQRT